MHRVLHSRRDQAQLTHDHNLSQPRSRSSCHSSCLRPGLPARRGGAAMIFTVHEAGPAARARRASGRSEAARWRAQEDRMEVASPSPRPWRLLGCEGPPHAGLGFSAWARPCAVGRLGEMSGVTGGWCVDRGGRVRFIKVATQIEPPSRVSQRSLRTGRGSSVRHGAHQARIVPCGAPFVGIRRARARKMTTNWRHTVQARGPTFGLRASPEACGGLRARPRHGARSCSSDDSRLY